jgi:hypothetical protein
MKRTQNLILKILQAPGFDYFLSSFGQGTSIRKK